MNKKMKIGIEAIAFDIPQYYLEMGDLAVARNVEPAKFIQGIGQKQMAVATPCEDTVVLAASAGQRLLKNYNIDPQSISLLIVGTETGVDHSKPVSSYVHQMLGISSQCRVFEIKHACFGAMSGLTTAMNYLLSGKARGKKALVIASDIARYGLNTPGEPTQGAGAVAMLISDQPDLLELDVENEGFYATQVMDFWRPLYSKEAFADGHYSIQCYLGALKSAYEMYKKNFMASSLSETVPVKEGYHFSEIFNACLYHVPFVKMARKAHQQLMEVESGYAFEKDAPELKTVAADYEKRVAPYLDWNARIGNIYTGALFLSLCNLLEKSSSALTGKRVSLFSYGSGCGAEFMSGEVAENASSRGQAIGSEELFSNRKALTVEQYEKIMEGCANMDSNNSTVCDPALWNLNRRILYHGTKDHKRIYSLDGKVLN